MRIVLHSEKGVFPKGPVVAQVMQATDITATRFPDKTVRTMLALALGVKAWDGEFEVVAGYVPEDSGLSLWLCPRRMSDDCPPELVCYRENMLGTLADGTIETLGLPFESMVWTRVELRLTPTLRAVMRFFG